MIGRGQSGKTTVCIWSGGVMMIIALVCQIGAVQAGLEGHSPWWT